MLKVVPTMGWSQWRNNTTFDERYSEILYWIEKELEERASVSNDSFDIQIWSGFLETKTIPSNYVMGVGLVCRIFQDLDISGSFGWDEVDCLKNQILVERS